MENSGTTFAMSNADTVASSRLPRAMAAGSAPCLNKEALRWICTCQSPGAAASSVSLNTVHMRACQSSGTAGDEARSSVEASVGEDDRPRPTAGINAGMARDSQSRREYRAFKQISSRRAQASGNTMSQVPGRTQRDISRVESMQPP